MTPEQTKLYQRIHDFSIDEKGVPYPFSLRLAKENNWPLDYTRRAITEYKRFMFLCIAAEHTVGPSDQVDQVWHQHLTYTRSYWDQFCKNILGKPVHHNPTQGGSSQHNYHRSMYQQTLGTYQKLFDQVPPIDIWPNCDTRFSGNTNSRRVNINQNWIIPKPKRPWPLKNINL